MCNIYKKHSAFLAIFMALTISVCAQTYTDTIKPFSGTKGFRTWSIGINGGVLFPAVAMGGTNNFSNPQITLGYGIDIKYQWTHWFALQVDVIRGKLKGNQDNALDNRPSGGSTVAFPEFRNVKSFVTDLHYAASLNGVFTLGNINWLSVKNKIIPYVALGGGIASYKPEIVTRVPSANGGAPYTTSAQHLYQSNGNSINHFFVPVGMGLKFNLSRSINLDLGYRMHFVDADDLDGYDYADRRNGPNDIGLTLHKDKFSYAFLGLEFVLGNKAKPQLMFDNPAARMNSNLQNQIDVLRSMLDFKDTDGDGVMDQFDKEPNTPAGCPVDTHGVTRDTDGDGVPDCKDQQLITPTECQPVDANGVGKCPPPECCTQIKAEPPVATCTVGDLPSLSFKGNAATLSADAKAILASVAAKLKESPICTITVTGYPAASKASQAVCNKRTDAIRTYLMNNEGISADRLSVNCEVGGGDANTIDLKVK
ncbi:MAG: OmpA family protein [Chitinophagaceae bacterium]|nr:OmpA family protein [Chitinophagaceae bacterium]MDB5222812.1 OmpA family protein [Chitinophagaceae bacterium]